MGLPAPQLPGVRVKDLQGIQREGMGQRGPQGVGGITLVIDSVLNTNINIILFTIHNLV
jgi:hypothetical protein